MLVDVTRKVSLWEWSQTDASWHRTLLVAWNAYVEERAAVREDAERVELSKRGAVG